MALLALGLSTMAVVGALITLILYAGDPAELWWWLLAVPFGAWVVGPAIMPYFFAQRFHARGWFVYVMLAFLAVSSAWSAGIYYHAFFVSTSSTAALVMIFVPLYQWGAISLLGVLGVVANICYSRCRSSD